MRTSTCILGLALTALAIAPVLNRHLFAVSAAKADLAKRVTAAELLAAARKANASMIKNARSDNGLDPKVAKNKPFYAGAAKIAVQLDRADKGLAARSNDFFDGIARARIAQAQMKVTWELTGSKNRKVIEEGRKLGYALALLRTDYSREAVRKKQGGELTVKEKEQFGKIKAEQKRLLARIEKLKLEATSDKAFERGLAKMQGEARKIVSAPMTVANYVAALYLLDRLQGQLYGYDYYFDPSWREDWFVIDSIALLWSRFYLDFWDTSTYDWANVDTPVDLDMTYGVWVKDSIPASQITSEENFLEGTSFNLTDSEKKELALGNDQAAVEDEFSMADASDEVGQEMEPGNDAGNSSDPDEDDDGGDES